MKTNFLRLIIPSIILLMVISSCNNPTTTARGSIVGKIVVLDNDGMELDDGSDLTIALYKSTELDTSLVRIYAQHPNIGFTIDQDTEFDHRFQQPYKTIKTAANGSFELTNIPVGQYNLVAMKAEEYYHQLTGLVVTKNGQTALEPMQIYPVQKLSGFYTENFLFESDKVYHVQDDCTFLSPVEIAGGCNIYIQERAMVSFMGKVEFDNIENNRYWRIDSASGLFDLSSGQLPVESYFGSIQFNAPDQMIKGGIIRHSLNGINIAGMNSILEDLDINMHDAALSFSAGPTQVKRLCLRNTDARALQMMSMTDSIYVADSIFYNNHDALILYSGGGFFVKNNYFQNNDKAILPQNCEGTIQNNSFFNNQNDITQYIARAVIEYNNFFYSNNYAIYPRNWASIKNNNFYDGRRYFINIRRSSAASGSCVLADLDATRNYWKPADLDPYILDANDNNQYPPDQQCRYYVLTEPRLSRAVANAGVQ